MAEDMSALAEAQDWRFTRLIGVSDFTVALLRKVIGVLSGGRIVINQIELSRYLQNRSLAAFMREQDVHLTSYMALAYGEVLGDPVLKELAR